MDAGLEEATEFKRELSRIENEVRKLCEAIAEELLAQPPRNSARLAGAKHQITHLIRQYAPISQRIVAAQGAAATRAREAGIPGGKLPQPWYDLGIRAHHFRNALNRWSQVQALIAAQQPPRRRPLYRVAEDPEDIVAAQHVSTDALMANLHAILNPNEQDPASHLLGAFADIGMPHSRFLAHAHAAYRVLLAQNVTSSDFLDVGCGGGIKVLTAANLFERATGIELDPGYAQSARKLFDAVGRRDCRVLELDAAEFPDYRFYDVVYLYRPMRHEEAMKDLEEIVVSQVRPGTLLIAPYMGFAARHGGLGCQRVAGSVYVAGLGEAAATELREAAEYTGASYGRRIPDLPDVWEPVLSASSARGFGLRGVTWADSV